MQHVDLFERKTLKYVDGWAHEDRWDYLGSLKLTPAVMTRQPHEQDFSDGGAYVQFARIPASADWRKLARAVQQTLSGSGCRHEYDCCGCASYRVFTKLVSPRKLLIRTSVTYNY